MNRQTEIEGTVELCHPDRGWVAIANDIGTITIRATGQLTRFIWACHQCCEQLGIDTFCAHHTHKKECFYCGEGVCTYYVGRAKDNEPG